MACKSFVLMALWLTLLQVIIGLRHGTNNSCSKHNETDLYCCPDYFEEDDICKPCKPGFFAKDCNEPCIENSYGVQCKNICNCSPYEICDKEYGCTCQDGYTGKNCTEKCNPGLYGKGCRDSCEDNFYGLYCLNRCNCSSYKICNKVYGCVCQAGYRGEHCNNSCETEHFGINCSELCNCPDNALSSSYSPGYVACSVGHFGINCTEECSCQDGFLCDHITGTCLKRKCVDDQLCIESNDDNTHGNPKIDSVSSSHYVRVYITMAALVVLLVVIVASVIKLKERIGECVRRNNVTSVHFRSEIPKHRTSNREVNDVTLIESTPRTRIPSANAYCEISEMELERTTLSV